MHNQGVGEGAEEVRQHKQGAAKCEEEREEKVEMNQIKKKK